MVWCRAGLRGDFLSVYTDFFTSNEPSKTTETRMHYTMCYAAYIILSYSLVLNLLFHSKNHQSCQ